MPHRYQFAASLLVLAWLLSATAKAEIFKCVAENGELTYSQTPCPEIGTKVTVMKPGGNFSDEPADCEHARRFALDTAQKMKSGTGSSALFDSYGGLGALSKGSVGLISYVFGFRTNTDVSAVRVSALATAKCQARSFGDVSCEQLPISFTNGFGGCNNDEDGPDSTTASNTDGMNAQAMHSQTIGAPAGSTSSQDTTADTQARSREAGAIEEERRLECRDRLNSQIDSINTRMRSGYTSAQGESFRKRLRDLEMTMRDC